MAKAKKILSIFLSVILILGIFANHPYALRTAFAEETEFQSGENATVSGNETAADEASKDGDEQKSDEVLSEAVAGEEVRNLSNEAAGESLDVAAGSEISGDSNAAGTEAAGESLDVAVGSEIPGDSNVAGTETAGESLDVAVGSEISGDSNVAVTKTVEDSLDVAAGSEISGEEATESLADTTAGEVSVTVTTWQELMNAANNASDGQVIYLGQDIKNTEGKDRIQIKSGKNIILDLNGHELNRNRSSSDSDGHVIEVFGTLTIRDSATGGTITGGYATNGGGVNVHGGTLIMKGGSIAGNHASNGGGIYVNDGSCTIEGGSITENTASYGGGIYVNGSSDSSLTMTGGEINKNTASTSGGGIYSNKSIDLTDVTLSENKANGSDSKNGGGGLYMEEGSATLTRTSFLGNYAKKKGGAIFTNADSTITLTGATVSKNKADTQGGAFYIQTGKIKMEGGTLSDSEAPEGGGVYVSDDTSFTASDNVVFSGNKATQHGGGAIFNKADGNVSLKSCTLEGNSAGTDGGGIWSNSTLSLGGKMIVQNNGTSNIYLNSDVITVASKFESGSVLGVTSKNYDRKITSGFAKKGHTATDIPVIFHLDAAESPDLGLLLSGGEVYVGKIDYIEVDSWSQLQDAVDNATDGRIIKLTANVTAGSSDKRIKIPSDKSVIIDLNGKLLDRNREKEDEENDGHVIEVFGTLTVRDSSAKKHGTIRGGSAENGGGINVNGGMLYFESGEVAHNKAKDGGGIYVNGDGTLVMTGGMVHENKADDEGGGIFSYNAASFADCTISKNTAKNKGGGIYHDDGNTITLKNVTLTENKVTHYSEKDGGGALYLDSGSAEITGGSITKNQGNCGGGIYMNSSSGYTVSLTEVTLSENTANASGGAVFVQTAKVTMDGCTVNGNSASATGGGINVTDDTSFEAKKTIFKENKCSGDQGGAIYSEGDVTLKGNCSFTGNEGNKGGGAIYAKDGTVSIQDAVFTSNMTARGDGGAICITEDGFLQLTNVEITENRASDYGGGIFTEKSATIGGKMRIESNTSLYGKNVCLNENRYLRLTAELEAGSKIGIYAKKPGTVTADYALKHKDVDVNTFFFPDSGYALEKDGNGEVYIRDSEWAKLQQQIDESKIGATIELDQNWWADEKDQPLVIPQDKRLTIDLKGFFLDGRENLSPVIKVEGTLILQDSQNGFGEIRGGKGTFGGILVAPTGNLTINGGMIRDNEAENGAGIYNMGTLTFIDGEISENTATESGAGIYNTGTLVMQGGRIADNTAIRGGGIVTTGTLQITAGEIVDNVVKHAGGGVYITDGTATIMGGSLTGNRVTGNVHQTFFNENGYGVFIIEDAPVSGEDLDCEYGGGICVLGTASLNLFGGIVRKNSAKKEGGGIYCGENSSLHVSGNPLVQENTASLGSNILLANGQKIIIEGSLTEGAALDLGAKVVSEELTSHFAEYDCRKEVFSYNGEQDLLELRNGELYLRSAAADVWVSSWSELQNAINQAGNQGKVIGLTRSIRATKDDDCLEVDGKKVTIELNGQEIDRHLFYSYAQQVNERLYTRYGSTEVTYTLKEEEFDNDGHVFEVIGSDSVLTIRDSIGTGAIRGGYAQNGGGINVNGGTCILESGTITGNRAEDGGGIYVNGSGTLTVTGGTICDNSVYSDGGGIFAVHSITLSNCSVTGNLAQDDGGGLYLHDSNGTAKLTNVIFDRNEARDDGGGIYVEEGRVEITGGSVSENKAFADGGGLRLNQDGKGLIANDVIIDRNEAKRGGGICLQTGTAEVVGGSISENEANSTEEGGGGIAVRSKTTMTVDSVTIKDNNAIGSGGGIWVDNGTLKIKGGLVVEDNLAAIGNNISLSKGRKLELSGELTDKTSVGVTLSEDLGVFTSGYGSYNGTKDPDYYFFSDKGYEISMQNGEGAFFTETLLDDEGILPFIEKNSQIVTNRKKLTGASWMSGISGERALNEINIPVAHDSAMNEVLSLYVGSGGSLLGGAAYAKTQHRYIDELLEDGVRSLDIRLTNRYEKITVLNGFIMGMTAVLSTGLLAIGEFVTEILTNTLVTRVDDGENLWLCHGKSKSAGTYYGADHNGDRLSLKKVFTYVKDFLKKHPRETVILTFDAETTTDAGASKTMNRLCTYLKDLTKETNPSTGKSYVYWENGELEPYSRMPKLKECRGQIVVKTTATYLPMIGGLYDSTGMNKVYDEDEAHYTALEKIKSVKAFYQNYGMPDIPVNAYDGSHYDFLYAVGTHAHGEKWYEQLPWEDAYMPIASADEVQKELFRKDGLFDVKGKYVGWVRQDGNTAVTNRFTWEANFSPNLDYCTVTVQSGLDEGKYPTQTYQLLRGTKISIPGCIYKDEENRKEGAFMGWKALGGKSYQYKDEYEIKNDVTFLAQWGDDPVTQVSLVFKDGDNLENLRPAEVAILVNGQKELTLTEENQWKGSFTGKIESIVPVFDKLVSTEDYPQGQDKEGEYRYEVSGDVGEEMILTLIHTPAGETHPTGTVIWDDSNDYDKLRPESVTLRLLSDGTEKASVEALAANDWTYDLGVYPTYANGEAVRYVLTEDSVPEYSADIEGFAVTNTHLLFSQIISGTVTWMDGNNENGTRPKSVTVRLLANGQEIDRQTVEAGEYYDWSWGFDVAEYMAMHNGESVRFSITEDTIPGYVTVVDTDDLIYNIKNKYGSEIYFRAHSLTLGGDIGVNYYLKLTEEEAENAKVSFKWFNKELKDQPVTFDKATGLYKVSCPVAVAEMTYDITATLTLGGRVEEENVYSVRRYANVILGGSDFRQNFIEHYGEERYKQLCTLILHMLAYGARAQLSFDRNKDYLATQGWAELVTPEKAELTKTALDVAEKINTGSSDMNEGLEAYGLEYVGPTLVFLSETSLRLYYKVVDQELFDAVKDKITLDGYKTNFREKDGMIFFEKRDIPAAELDRLHILKIGEKEYGYAALDYVKQCLVSESVAENTKLLALATYYYYEAAKDFFMN